MMRMLERSARPRSEAGKRRGVPSLALVLSAIAALASGCTRDAVLELELDLPAQPSGGAMRYAVVQVQSDGSFDGTWADVPLSGQPLAASCTRPEPTIPCDDRMLDPTCSEVISVVAGQDAIAQPLSVRVRFCSDPTCSAPEDATAPERRVVIERAFYLGHYTQARVCIDDVPAMTDTDPQIIPRCEVRCREGSSMLQCRLDGTHFCE